jgi:hypothetical protein
MMMGTRRRPDPVEVAKKTIDVRTFFGHSCHDFHDEIILTFLCFFFCEYAAGSVWCGSVDRIYKVFGKIWG